MTEATFQGRPMPGWLSGANSTQPERRPSARLVTESGNWPIPLVTRREPARMAADFDADWFNQSEASSQPGSSLIEEPFEHGPVLVVSRTRVRVARALFTLLFLGVLALLAYELHLYFTGYALRLPGR